MSRIARGCKPWNLHDFSITAALIQELFINKGSPLGKAPQDLTDTSINTDHFVDSSSPGLILGLEKESPILSH